MTIILITTQVDRYFRTIKIRGLGVWGLGLDPVLSDSLTSFRGSGLGARF